MDKPETLEFNKKSDIELGNDNIARITISTWYLPKNLKESLKDATNIDWKFYGHFMDVACYGITKEKYDILPEKFIIKLTY